MSKKICGAKRTYEGVEHVCHRKPGHTKWWHQNEDGDFRWKPDIDATPRFKDGTPDVGVAGLARLLKKLDAAKISD
ncbi:hypothetical protein P8936_16400 [Edaphobacter paludis]|uniref:Uncharacterized protein n=1 Tax=Edaphobacter paludis TaxID=3035702 RepID=A0AAU7D7X3_9BACT